MGIITVCASRHLESGVDPGNEVGQSTKQSSMQASKGKTGKQWQSETVFFLSVSFEFKLSLISLVVVLAYASSRESHS